MYLYHYTKAQVLEKILACSALWMNPVYQVKDDKESSQAASVSQETFNRTENFPLSEKDERFIKNIRDNSYCACFSDNGINEHLMNEYGDSKRGLILVFNSTNKIINSTPAFSDTVNEKNYFPEYAGVVKMQYQPYRYPQLEGFHLGIHYFYATQYKHENFKQEEEVRFYYHAGSDSNIKLPPIAKVRDCTDYHACKDLMNLLQFDLKKSKVSVHFDTFNVKSSFYLSGIIRLENCLLSEEDISNLLNRYGFNNACVESRF